LPARHVINIALGLGLIALIVWFFEAQQHLAFWLIAAVSFLLGVLLYCRHLNWKCRETNSQPQS
jgi:NAD(P) transhydrogenase subunit beta